MNKAISFLMFLIVVLFSCNYKNSKKVNQVSDKVKIPYVEDSLVKSMNRQSFLTHFAKLIGLSNVSDSSKKLSVRVWIGYEPDKRYILDISKTSDKQECNIIEYEIPVTKDSSSYIIINHWKNTNPISGWSNFFDSLLYYKIPYLENGDIQNKTKDFVIHGSCLEFEIGQQGKYRNYLFYDPSFYRCIDTNSNNVYRFLMFVNSEMNSEAYKSYPNCLIDKK